MENKKQGKFDLVRVIGVLLLVFFVYIGFQVSKDTIKDPIIQKQNKINYDYQFVISIGEDEKSVIEKLGKGDYLYDFKIAKNDTDFFYKDKGIIVMYDDYRKVREIQIHGLDSEGDNLNKYKGNIVNNLKTSDSLNDVIRKLGNYSKVNKKISFFEIYNWYVLGYDLEVSFSNDKIFGITIIKKSN